MNDITQRTRSAPLIVCTVLALSALSMTPGMSAQHQVAAQQANCQTFTETGKVVCGSFLTYWKEHGGVIQQGYPISSELNEVSEVDGKSYTVQYFERAVFEYHPENQAPNDVLLSLLGSAFYKQRYPGGVTGQQPNTSAGSVLFSETGKRLGGRFLDYWKSHGGVMQQGYPISDEFQEKSDLDGKSYTVQYFERAVFEYHPENQPPYDILPSQLGTFQFKRRYLDAVIGSPVPNPTPDALAMLRKRPLALPTLAPGSECPVSPKRKLSPAPPPNLAAEYVLGDGPLYPVAYYLGGGLLSLENMTEEVNKGYQVKVRWIGGPSYEGFALVRGRQLDGPGVLLIAENTEPLQKEMPLRVVSGWNDWPASTLVPSPGCYGYQVDGLNFTEVIVFKAVATKP